MTFKQQVESAVRLSREMHDPRLLDAARDTINNWYLEGKMTAQTRDELLKIIPAK